MNFFECNGDAYLGYQINDFIRSDSPIKRDVPLKFKIQLPVSTRI